MSKLAPTSRHVRPIDQPQPVTPLLYRLPQVAELLQLSQRTVESLIASGELPSITVGKSRRVFSDDLLAFASRGTAKDVS